MTINRILFIITQLTPGGAEKQLVRTAAHIQSTGADVTVLSLSQSARALEQEPAGASLSVRLLDRDRPRATRLLELARVLRESKPDRVVAWLPAAWLYSSLAQPMTIPRADLVLAERNSVANDTAAWRIARTTMARRAKRIAANSDAAVEAWRALRPTTEVVRTVNFPPVVRPLVHKVPSPEPVFGLVARLTHQKGVDVAIQALAELRRRGITRRLIVVGNGPDRGSLQDLAVLCGVDDLVQWRPPTLTSVSEMADLVDVLLLPSRWEGQSNTLAEALAGGLPVLASGAHEAPGPGFQIPYVSDLAPAAWADAITNGSWRRTAVHEQAWADWQGRAAQTAERAFLS